MRFTTTLVHGRIVAGCNQVEARAAKKVRTSAATKEVPTAGNTCDAKPSCFYHAWHDKLKSISANGIAGA